MFHGKKNCTGGNSDQVDLKELNDRKKLLLCLVDHHTLSEQDTSLADSVVQVIDHRPQDPNWLWTGRDINFKKVGSCATLIAKNIIDNNINFIDPQVAKLLMGKNSIFLLSIIL